MDKIGALLSQPLLGQAAARDQEQSTVRPGVLEQVEALFKALSVHYGAARMGATWAGLNPDEVKRYWAGKLAGLSAEAARYALNHLPSNPPTVDEFLAAAGRYRPAAPSALALGSPKNDEAGRQRARELASKYGQKAQTEA